MIPRLICKLFGHKFTRSFYTYSQDHMWRYTNVERSCCCFRCGIGFERTIKKPVDMGQ